MRAAILLLSTFVLLGTTVARATDANLDPSFGTFGATIIDPLPSAPDEGRAVAIQPDGKIVVAGTVVARFTTTGQLDPSFGSGGIVTTSLEFVQAVAIQTDGRILVVGTADGGSGDPTTGILRLDASGAADGTFGTAGTAHINTVVSSGDEAAVAVGVQSDGRIVVTGWYYDVVGGMAVARMVVVRVLADGTPDPSFGTGGVKVISLAGSAFPTSLVLQSDGKIVVGGYVYVPQGSGQIQAFMVARFETDGDLDPGFGTGGIVVTGPLPNGSALGSSVALQPDDKIVLGGFVGQFAAAARYLPSGSPDGAFGTAGLAEVAYPSFEFALINDMVLRPDGKIVLVGWVQRPTDPDTFDTAVVRLNGDGTPDATFAAGGTTRIVIGPAASGARSAALQADGRLVLAGAVSSEIYTLPDGGLMVARLGGSCGDAFLDAGEQCDDGNNDGFDCCSAGCGFDPAGQFCTTADADPCTYDTCDGAGTCQVGGPWPASRCREVTQPAKSTLSITNKADASGDRLAWKWTKGETTYPFDWGVPSNNTSYALCLFSGSSLVSEHPIAAGAGWSSARDWKLKRDPITSPGGISSAVLASAGGYPGKAKIKVKGKGPLLAPPALPLATPVRVQLVSSISKCFEATYTTPLVTTAERFKAKGQ
jgi:uncharacterized delta-60 repeat protein